MKYSDQRELVEGLRALANEIEEKGLELPIRDMDGFKLTQWVYDDRPSEGTRTVKDKLAQAARVLGNVDKIYSGDWFDLEKKFGPITLQFTSTRNAVCRRVVTGTEIVPAETIERPERVKEIVEWVCDEPLLAS